MNAKLRRCIWFVLGILLNSLGIVLITKAALGTSPISSLPYVLSFAFPLTLGQFTFLVNLLFIAGQMVLRRRNFAPIQLLQIVVNVIFSGCIDNGDTSVKYRDQASVSNLAGQNTDGDRITLYAQWEANSYTIRLDPGDGQGEVKDSLLRKGRETSERGRLPPLFVGGAASLAFREKSWYNTTLELSWRKSRQMEATPGGRYGSKQKILRQHLHQRPEGGGPGPETARRHFRQRRPGWLRARRV